MYPQCSNQTGKYLKNASRLRQCLNCVGIVSVLSFTGLAKQKISIFSYPSILTYVFVGAQKNGLIETVLLSTHNICFG